MFTGNLTIRVDENTSVILDSLTGDMNYSKSEVIRRSLRVLKELTDIKKEHGKIKLWTDQNGEFFVLLG